MEDSVKKSLRKFAQFGIGSKGAVYILAGGLTAAAALGMSTQSNSGKNDALSFVYSQPFGKVLLCIMGVGLLGYTFYKFVIGYKYNKPDKPFWLNWGKKIAYFGSGLLYASIAFTAIKMALTSQSSGGDGNSKQSIIQELLGSTLGQIVLFVFACIIIGRACFQFYLSWTGKFTKRIKESKLDEKSQKAMEFTGVFGYTSRGIVILIIAYMFIKAVLNNNPSQADGMGESFQLINSSFGPYVLAVIAFGLCSYGIFMLFKAYYTYVPEID